MTGNNYSAGRWAENLVKDKLMWKVGRKIIRHTNYDEDGNEIWQNVVINGNKYICPDLEVEDIFWDESLEMRVEVKSFRDGFPNNIPFETKQDILIVSKTQLDKYMRLQQAEEVPIFVVFVVDKQNPKFYWASLNDMFTSLKRREGIYTWEMTGKTEPCYFFLAKQFCADIETL